MKLILIGFILLLCSCTWFYQESVKTAKQEFSPQEMLRTDG